MSRAADYAIKGFLYQFNKTALAILRSEEGSSITLEGILEDVEITSHDVMTAIQCKYHEASDTFTPSRIYKPLLQMMQHFHANPSAGAHYVLFAHFPSVAGQPEPAIGLADLQAALKSKNKELQEYVAALVGQVDLAEFLARFTMEFGPSYDDLVAEVCSDLAASGIPAEDIETLAYPNAINMIAGTSAKHDPAERTTTKREFLESLNRIRQTAISRWTMALRNRKQLLDARRKQLKTHLDVNSRLRYLLVDAESLEDYAVEMVLFVRDFLDKYHSKLAHISTPTLCLCTSEEDFKNVQFRLFEKGIISTDGYVADRFVESRFFRDPLVHKVGGGVIQREFSLRLLRWEDHGEILDDHKCDDLFIIGEPQCSFLNTLDVNVEQLAATSLREVGYLMGVRNVYE